MSQGRERERVGGEKSDRTTCIRKESERNVEGSTTQGRGGGGGGGEHSWRICYCLWAL